MYILLLFLYYLYLGLDLYLYFITIVLILSWIPGIREHRWFATCERIADFYIGRFHGLIVFRNADFTPIIGIILFEIFLYFFGYIINFIGA